MNKIATWVLVYQAPKTYRFPDRPNDEHRHAKHVWKFFALAYVLYVLWLIVKEKA